MLTVHLEAQFWWHTVKSWPFKDYGSWQVGFNAKIFTWDSKLGNVHCIHLFKFMKYKNYNCLSTGVLTYWSTGVNTILYLMIFVCSRYSQKLRKHKFIPLVIFWPFSINSYHSLSFILMGKPPTFVNKKTTEINFVIC